ncbi:MAG: helix-turn-helix domain-containing protein [Reyranella sp.]|jgi:transcriptional regulator with XRE-family HTH domain|nr:helix-turn-helix domain-containing protein [Reyranella sp.]
MLHNALRLLRKFHDKSQTDMAVALGVSKSWISQIEAGNRRPTLELLEKYAAVFEVPTSSILFFAEHLKDNSFSERVRVSVASKVLHAMDFIDARAGRSDE